MKPMEKLARDLCWNEFIRPGKGLGTKAAYWKSLSPEKRAEYEKRARMFVFDLGRLTDDMCNLAHSLYVPM